MASKTLPLLTIVTLDLLFIIPSLLYCPTSSLSHDHKNSSSSPFEFLEHLKGSHKGDHIQGILDLKLFLEKFGYLSYGNDKNHTHADDDDFDDVLESAVKDYQHYFHLRTTGTLDGKTVSKMMKPRCGVSDHIGVHKIDYSKKDHIHEVSHYSFFSSKQKWPPSKYHLTYAFAPGTPSEAMTPIAQAFQTWAASTNFKFRRHRDYKKADIKISFEQGDHGDGSSFDGTGGILAHAYAPTYGKLHYDADEPWSIGALEGYYDLETVALHEIGHLLGLAHSSEEDAIMYPYISSGVTKLDLHHDDIHGIRALYKSH